MLFNHKNKAVTAQPFTYNGDFDVFTYRIPCLLTLNDGDVMAVTDLRVNILDSPNNIEIGVRVLDSKTGEWGASVVAHQFNDYDQQFGTNTYNPAKDSASFIDAAITQTADGRIFMLVDAMPANAGGGIGGKDFNGTVKNGDTVYYALTMGDNTLATGYDYYMYPNPNSTAEHDKYIVKRVSDSSDTAYTLDAHFNVYQNGVALTVKQKPKLEIDVPMNIFYSASVLKLHRTSYFYLSYSDDKGKTWSDPMLIGSEYRKIGETVFNKAPGVGLVIQKGEYAGRILFPLYRGGDFSNSISVSCLYSDDNGSIWQMGETIPIGTFPNATEAQLVELPDGTLRIYSRGQGDYILYADSTDGGMTFGEMREDTALPYCRDCMVSVLALPWKIDGKDAIAISYPEGNKPGGKRANGVIKIGLLDKTDSGYEVEWKYSYSIGGSYSYSCLATNGQRIAVLYERDAAVHTNELVYLELPLEAFGIIDVN
ncbi:MAG: exo-alpha-sialidase [Ruminococcaceae bacterium]|nr:exo-alpha-sialidase [Oscillospiraceae bacterium]